MTKLYVDLSLSLEVDSSSLIYEHIIKDIEITYDELQKLDKSEQENYVIASIQDLVSNSTILDSLDIKIEESD